MTKHMMLGVNENYCCVLYCLFSFDDLELDKLESSDFTHKSTNWCGRDTVERTLTLMKMKKTGRYYKLETPLIFMGNDCDCGHVYPWEFEVTEIWEVTND